jgi:hypothetical protein
MSGGGAGGSGTQKYEWNDAMAPHWANALSWGQALTDPSGYGAYDQYQGQRIADMNSSQHAGLGRVADIFSAGGTDASRAAGTQAASTLGNGYLTGTGANPFSARNIYEGDNPYFQQQLTSGLEDITNAYQQGTSADTTRLFNLSGAFGGSAHQDAISNNESNLARQLGDYTNKMRSGQFDRSAGLYDSYLGRGSSNYEGERGRQMSALGYGAQDLQSQLGLGNAMLGVGDVYRGFTQDHLTQDYSDWQEMQNQQYRMLDYYSGILGRAQGGMSPNMTQTSPSYSASPFSQVIGAGLLGYGMMR